MSAQVIQYIAEWTSSATRSRFQPARMEIELAFHLILRPRQEFVVTTARSIGKSRSISPQFHARSEVKPLDQSNSPYA
jgi:hypothetical protein